MNYQSLHILITFAGWRLHWGHQFITMLLTKQKIQSSSIKKFVRVCNQVYKNSIHGLQFKFQLPKKLPHDALQRKVGIMGGCNPTWKVKRVSPQQRTEDYSLFDVCPFEKASPVKGWVVFLQMNEPFVVLPVLIHVRHMEQRAVLLGDTWVHKSLSSVKCTFSMEAWEDVFHIGTRAQMGSDRLPTLQNLNDITYYVHMLM